MVDRPTERPTPLAPSPQPPRRTEDQIDEVLKDSFPASDPPPWTLGTARAVGPSSSEGGAWWALSLSLASTPRPSTSA